MAPPARPAARPAPPVGAYSARLPACQLELALHRLGLVRDLESLLQDRDRLLRASRQPQRVAEVEERKGVVDVAAVLGEGGNRPLEDRDRLLIAARLDQLEALGVESGSVARPGARVRGGVLRDRRRRRGCRRLRRARRAGPRRLRLLLGLVASPVIAPRGQGHAPDREHPEHRQHGEQGPRPAARSSRSTKARRPFPRRRRTHSPAQNAGRALRALAAPERGLELVDERLRGRMAALGPIGEAALEHLDHGGRPLGPLLAKPGEALRVTAVAARRRASAPARSASRRRGRPANRGRSPASRGPVPRSARAPCRATSPPPGPHA